MSVEGDTIRVNFSRPIPIFPLDGVVLLPHAMLHLFIFEPRYRQMIEHVLDGPGQIAMAVFDGESWENEYHANPPVKPAVCLGQIAHHERQPDGTYRCWLQGVCRARIEDECPPDAERLYREAILRPIGSPGDADPLADPLRERVRRLLSREPLCDLAPVRQLVEQFTDEGDALEEIPGEVLLELAALSIVGPLDRPGVLYRLLAEEDDVERAELVVRELECLRTILERVGRQFDPDAPRGVSWN